MNTQTFKSIPGYLKPLSLACTVTLALTACSSDDYDEPMVNKAPVVVDAMVVTQTEVAVDSQLVASDPDNDTLTYALVSEPTLGSVMLNADGTYRYEPKLETTGMDSFEFAVSDGINPAVNAIVSITIEQLEVNFNAYSRQAFEQSANDEPLRINGRIFTNTDAQIDFSDLVDNNQ